MTTTSTPDWIKALVQHDCKIKVIADDSVVVYGSYSKGNDSIGFEMFDSLLVRRPDRKITEYVYPAGKDILKMTSKHYFDNVLDYLGY